MYCNMQTLKHKTLGFVARLVDEDTDSAFYWGVDKFAVIDQNGVLLTEYKLGDFEPILDEFDRPIGGLPKEGEFVNKKCLEYSKKTKKELADLRNKKFQKAINEVLKKLEDEGEYFLPFSIDGRCIPFMKWFLKQVCAVPLFEIDTSSSKHYWDKVLISRDFKFTYNGMQYIYVKDHSTIFKA